MLHMISDVTIELGSLGACADISIMSVVSCVRMFEWNIEASLTKMQDFEWEVGDGPLFWWRIEFQKGDCPPNSCSPSIDDCMFFGPLVASCCSVVCPPDGCISIDREVWTVLATSVEHLCERLSNECCNRRPQGFITSVKKYQRPALCCDVEKYSQDGTPIIDEYEDIPFASICKCASFINPCDMRIIFPCPTSVCVTNTEEMAFSMGGFNQSYLEPLRPAKEVVWSRFGGEVPAVLRLVHNFSRMSVFKDFLKSNALKVPANIPLRYKKSTDSWIGTLNFKGNDETWTLSFNCMKMEESEVKRFGWMFSLNVMRTLKNKKKSSQVVLELSTRGVRHKKTNFDLSFNFNTTTRSLVSQSGVKVYSKHLKDDIGVFGGNWAADPFLKLKIGL